MRKHRNLDEIVERSLEQIRTQRLPEQEVEAIAERVWSRLAAADPSRAGEVGEPGPIRGCDDYQALIPFLLDGTLSKSRRLLLESHSRECLTCRKALTAARRGEQDALVASPSAGSRPPYLRWAVAAALVAAVAAGSYWALALRSLEGQAAVVEPGGDLYRMARPGEGPVAAGESIDFGERLRTARGESALLELADGSIVEVRERSLLSLGADRRGTTIDLERGSVIVQAAPQRDGQLYVATDDCLVSVKGTIFSVDHGTKGSRVSVVEGRVVVDAGGRETLLLPGDQTTTHASLAMIPVAEDIAWSRDVDRYIELMREVTALRRALAEEVPRPAPRYASRLMDLVPETTAFYVALPNLAETIAEADRILRERIADSRLLQEWWESRQGLQRFGPSFDHVTGKLAELGAYLGDEVVVTARLDADDDIGSPLVLAELRDAAGLRRFVEQTIAEHGAGVDGEASGLVFIDDPAVAPPADGDVYVWMNGDTLIASDRLESLRSALGAVAGGPTGFAASRFGQRIADAYRDGAGVLIGADLERVAAAKLTEVDSGEERAMLEASGLLAADHFLLEQKWVDGATQHRAVLGFDGPRQGMAAWLAEPAPMGSLDFVSPDAKFAAAVLLVDPSVMLDQLLDLAVGTSGETGFDLQGSLDEMEAALGFDVRRDAMAAFGGEVALAVDGPLLPEPSWKLVLEVYDRTRAEFVLGQLAAFASRELVAAGREPIELVREEVGGRAFFSLAGSPAPFHFTFEDGYLIAAPNRGLLDRAIRYRQSGYTLSTASRFRSLLPVDGSSNFSAVFYQDAMSLLEPLAERIASRELTEEQRRALDSLAAESGPTLGYAYGEPERVVFAASGTMSLLDAGLPGLLGLGGDFDLRGVFRSIVAKDAVSKDTEQVAPEG
jgi:ferric-dicitrate binding protein FerR (iron transport regulator)